MRDPHETSKVMLPCHVEGGARECKTLQGCGTPQWSLQIRPTAVGGKPANGDGPEQGVFIACWPGQASL